LFNDRKRCHEIKMSWFNPPYSKKAIAKEETTYKRKYGKAVNRVSERKEYDLLPTDDDQIDRIDSTDLDDNIDEKYDYSDLED
jgi:hypothetical protein